MDVAKEEWVTLATQTPSGLSDLQTPRSSERLNQIDRVRAKGVGDHISLPQLVVCGDQSAGKSSVLEGITGIPFPRQDGLCTRFPTEIILRHQPSMNQITAKIFPAASRSANEKSRMQSFERQLSSFNDLPKIIQEASVLMGVRGDHSDPDPNLVTFAADVLRLEVVGDTGLHLTVVDLPGLISVSDDEEDIKVIEKLVDEYMESPRTIILAVVQANIDIDTQKIIQRSRPFDRAGERTVGIITKPDLINKGTESRVANLVKNIDKTKLRLGFFLLKNPAPLQLQHGITWDERTKLETTFFKSSPWKEQMIDPARLGIEQLRYFLQNLLDGHIERELPKVRKEVQTLLINTERELKQIGPERSSVGQIRMFLTRLSMEYHNIAKAAIEGNYDGRDADFFDLTKNRRSRLRAQVHKQNEQFSAYMRTEAMKRKIHGHQNDDSEHSDESTQSDQSMSSSNSNEESPVLVSRKQMLGWIMSVYQDTRGRELPGNYNHMLLSELFHEQSSRWADIAKNHVRSLSHIVNESVQSILVHTIADEQVRRNVRSRIQDSLDLNYRSAMQELENILLDEKVQPTTYNHYYTDNIQNAREEAMKKSFQDSMDRAIASDWNGKFHVSNTQIDLSKVVTCLKKRVIVDMNKQACSEALTDLDAYYKVAMKTFVDNVCRQVIERHILKGVTQVFNPVNVSQLSEEELTRIASETTQVRNRRNELLSLKQALEESVHELRD